MVTTAGVVNEEKNVYVKNLAYERHFKYVQLLSTLIKHCCLLL